MTAFDPKEALKRTRAKIAEEDRLANDPEYVRKQQEALDIPEEKMQPPPPKASKFDPKEALKLTRKRIAEKNRVPIEEIPYVPKNDGTFMDNALRAGKFMDDSVNETWGAIKSAPGALYDTSVQAVKALGEFGDAPKDTAKAAVAGLSKLVKGNEIDAYLDGKTAQFSTDGDDKAKERAYQSAYDQTLRENLAEDERLKQVAPNAYGVSPAVANVAMDYGSKLAGPYGKLVRDGSGIAMDAATQYADTGKVSPSKLIGNYFGGKGVTQIGKGVNAGAKGVYNTGAEAVAKSQSKALLAMRPEAEPFIRTERAPNYPPKPKMTIEDGTGPERVHLAENADVEYNRYGEEIKRNERNQPGLYNELAGNINDVRTRAGAKVQSEYGTMHEENAKNIGAYNPQENTPGEMLRRLKQQQDILHSNKWAAPTLEKIDHQISPDLRMNGKIGEIPDPVTGEITYGLVPLTPRESFERALQIRKIVNDTISREITASKKPGNPTIDVPTIAKLQEMGKLVTQAFDENFIKDMNPVTVDSHRKASNSYAKIQRNNKVQKKISTKEQPADTFAEIERVDADKLKSIESKIDERTKANIRKSTENQQAYLGDEPKNLYGDLHKNFDEITEANRMQGEVRKNQLEWDNLDRPTDPISQAFRNTPTVGRALNPKTQVKTINAWRNSKPILAKWIDKFSKAARPLNKIMVRSIAIQSRESEETVRKALEQEGIQVE